MWERFSYRTLDDLTALVAEAAKLPAIVEIRIRGGIVEIRTKDGVDFPQSLRTIRLPSDDLAEKVRGAGVDWRVIYRKSMRSALFEGINILRNEGLHATHIASGNLIAFYRALNISPGSDQGMTKWLAGLEMVEHSGLGDEVHLLCGGRRAHGSVSDIVATVRLEQEEDDAG